MTLQTIHTQSKKGFKFKIQLCKLYNFIIYYSYESFWKDRTENKFTNNWKPEVRYWKISGMHNTLLDNLKSMNATQAMLQFVKPNGITFHMCKLIMDFVEMLSKEIRSINKLHIEGGNLNVWRITRRLPNLEQAIFNHCPIPVVNINTQLKSITINRVGMNSADFRKIAMNWPNLNTLSIHIENVERQPFHADDFCNMIQCYVDQSYKRDITIKVHLHLYNDFNCDKHNPLLTAMITSVEWDNCVVTSLDLNITVLKALGGNPLKFVKNRLSFYIEY